MILLASGAIAAPDGMLLPAPAIGLPLRVS